MPGCVVLGAGTWPKSGTPGPNMAIIGYSYKTLLDTTDRMTPSDWPTPAPTRP
ncbi:unnamed protein product [Ectocarpus sp. CCAP 1310/34]|nr:unnamed protein product [Ectocarpus sp. CCAP 1310/34]